VTELLSRALLLTSITAVMVGCGVGGDPITADTTCEEYLQHTQTERHDAAVRISAEIDGVPSGGNPMWGLSLDAACGGSPSRTIGQFFRRDN